LGYVIKVAGFLSFFAFFSFFLCRYQIVIFAYFALFWPVFVAFPVAGVWPLCMASVAGVAA
jgi:hypothetical protein